MNAVNPGRAATLLKFTAFAACPSLQLVSACGMECCNALASTFVEATGCPTRAWARL